MSINGVLRTSVSGMNAQSNKLSSLSDNIANSSTTGYKRSSVEFETLLIDDNGGGYQSGAVLTDTRRSISLSGGIATTSSTSDLAIQGNGFFVVNDERGNEFYTRAGAFTSRTDEAGNTFLVNTAGYRLQGQNGDVTIPAVGELAPPEATTNATVDLQLPLNGTSGSSSFVAYNSRGESVTVNFTATKTAPDEWQLSFDAGNGPVTGTVTVDPTTGQQTGAFTLSGPLEMPVPAGTNVAQNPLTIQLNSVTSFDSDFSAKFTADGNPPSVYKGYEISDQGVVYGVLESGERKQQDIIKMATFQSPDRLEAMSGNIFGQSMDSGAVQYGQAGAAGFGGLLSGALEQSNVDLATELTDMIESQRAYGANSKVFQTGSEMMELLINLKR